MQEASGRFRVTDTHEETYADRDPGKLTRASGSQEFSGDIEGTGRVEWLMCYGDGAAEFIGMQEIEGTLDDRTGAFVLTSAGSFDGQRSQGSWTVVSGSGRGDLAGIAGTGTWKAGPGREASFQLSYELR